MKKKDARRRRSPEEEELPHLALAKIRRKMRHDTRISLVAVFMVTNVLHEVYRVPDILNCCDPGCQ